MLAPLAPINSEKMYKLITEELCVPVTKKQCSVAIKDLQFLSLFLIPDLYYWGSIVSCGSTFPMEKQLITTLVTLLSIMNI